MRTSKSESNTKEGDRFYKLVFTGQYAGNNSKGRKIGVFICDCGNLVKRAIYHVYTLENANCGCSNRPKLSILKSRYGDDYPFIFLLQRIGSNVGSMKSKTVDLTLTIQDLKTIWERQDGKCFYTGVDLKMPVSKSDSVNNRTPSIDRIDSNLGYTLENTNMVLKEVNFMKHTSSHADFIDMCKLIADNN